MRYSIGIDFGTTTTSIAYITDKSAVDPELIEVDGKKAIASVVRLKPDKTVELIGDDAWERYHEEPDRTFTEFKMDLGLDKNYVRSAFTITPEEVGEIFLRFLREHVESQFGRTSLAELDKRDGVVTVIGYPAEWGKRQKEAVVAIAKRAGFPNVEGGVEPVGAIYYHGRNGEIDLDREQKVFVYDFGGGTSDTALVAMSGTLPPHVYDFDGLIDLGGRDYDSVIIKNVIKPLFGDTQFDPADLAEFQRRAQSLKERLSAKIQNGDDKAEVHLVNLKCRSGGSQSLSLTKSEFEDFAKPYIGKFLAPVKAILQKTGFALKDIDYVIATGGSARLYFVDSSLQNAFPYSQYLRSKNPQEVIAKGLALFASKGEKVRRAARIAEDEVVPDVEAVPAALRSGNQKTGTAAPKQAINAVPGVEPQKRDPFAAKRNSVFGKLVRRAVVVALLGTVAMWLARPYVSSLASKAETVLPAVVSVTPSLPRPSDAQVRHWVNDKPIVVVSGWVRNDTWTLHAADIQRTSVERVQPLEGALYRAEVAVSAIRQGNGIDVTLTFDYAHMADGALELRDWGWTKVKKIGSWKYHHP